MVLRDTSTTFLITLYPMPSLNQSHMGIKNKSGVESIIMSKQVARAIGGKNVNEIRAATHDILINSHTGDVSGAGNQIEATRIQDINNVEAFDAGIPTTEVIIYNCDEKQYNTIQCLNMFNCSLSDYVNDN
ncbi:unnamed protein product [Rotaria sp. Silwood1]|nr:unnamed protein product [Rotaria sp. Silwood1]CAF1056767.1 unnamed protein product [Rotaria sp. Silwood1]CAF3436335.1 unnamed protein product [Rotaria sp. Silwood1]CAF4527349.1 unnamed protein product [Rotaria sp. Silwood1]CAF4698809.1 unnamed protein product [Rotaria sp. Silwood1]